MNEETSPRERVMIRLMKKLVREMSPNEKKAMKKDLQMILKEDPEDRAALAMIKLC